MENGNKKKMPAWAKALIAVLCVALVALAGYFALSSFLRPIVRDPMSAFITPSPRPETTAAPASSAPPSAAPEETPAPTLSPEEQLLLDADRDFMKNRVNVLLLGWDQSPEREEEGSALYRDEKNNFRSDVIMLMTADFDKNTLTLISVPRDSYVPIYNTKGRWKVNAAFAKGGSAEGDGFTYAQKTISNLLGVPVDYYMGVDMTGMKAVVDAMGGVDYDVDVKITLNGRVLEKGYQHLTGQQVLDYCRARKGISTDVGRADRQQRMLFAIFEQMKSRKQLSNIPNIYLSVKDYVHTNLNFSQIAALTMFSMELEMDDLYRYTLEGEYISGVYNASFYVLDNEKLVRLIKDVFGITITPDPRYDVNYVKADKAAAAASAYVSGAEYLETFMGYAKNAAGDWEFPKDEFGNEQPPKDYLAMRAAADKLLEVSTRALPANASQAQIDAAFAVSLDKKAIDAAQQKLLEEMVRFCTERKITRAKVQKKKLPTALYNLLPEAPEPSPTPASEASPSPSPTPAAENTQTTPKPGEE